MKINYTTDPGIPRRGTQAVSIYRRLNIRRVIQIVVVIVTSVLAITFVWGATASLYTPWALQFALAHFPAVVGLPSAALAAFALVVILEFSAGTIELKAFGLEFKGAAGPLVMWVMCFLAIVGAIKLLW